MRMLIIISVLIFSLLILAIAIFYFVDYQTKYKQTQLSENCEKIVKSYTIEDVSSNIIKNYKEEILLNYPSEDRYFTVNPNHTYEDYWNPFNKLLNDKIDNYLKSQEDRNISECILENR